MSKFSPIFHRLLCLIGLHAWVTRRKPSAIETKGQTLQRRCTRCHQRQELAFIPEVDATTSHWVRVK